MNYCDDDSKYDVEMLLQAAKLIVLFGLLPGFGLGVLVVKMGWL